MGATLGTMGILDAFTTVLVVGNRLTLAGLSMQNNHLITA
jgi:hypothetical protein